MGTVQYRPTKLALPLLVVLAGISTTIEFLKYMSIELQTPVADPHREDEENSDERLKNIEQEINVLAATIL